MNEKLMNILIIALELRFADNWIGPKEVNNFIDAIIELINE